MIRTVIIDAEKQKRDRIADLLSAEGSIKILAKGKDGYDALKLTGSLRPDIVIIDNHIEYIECGDIPPLLQVRSPSSLVLIMAGKISDYQLYKAASNKVSGFINNDTELYILPKAIKHIYEGGCFISPVLAARILRLFSMMNEKHINLDSGRAKTGKQWSKKEISPLEDPVGYLSKKELSILIHLSKGLHSREIADMFCLAVGTVRNYISSLMKKLGLESRTQLVCYAFDYCLRLPKDN